LPIRKADINAIEQVCAGCGAVHTLPLGHAFLKARKGPYAIAAGDTLELQIDGQKSTITFSGASFASGELIPVAEVAAVARDQMTGATVDLDGDALRITSRARGMGASSIRVTGGTAMETLGFDDRLHRPVCLGVTKGAGSFQQTAVDTIALPHCPECGARECLVRTWDKCPPGYEETFFAQHRRAVNALAEYLKAETCSDPDARARHEAERTSPPDIATDFATKPVIVAFATAEDTAEETT
jgi:hypothetical protein